MSLTWDIINYLRQPSDKLELSAVQNTSGGGAASAQQGMLVAAVIRFLRFRADRRQAVSAADGAEADWASRLEDAVKREAAVQDVAGSDGEGNSCSKTKQSTMKESEIAKLNVMRAKAELRRAVSLGVDLNAFSSLRPYR